MPHDHHAQTPAEEAGDTSDPGRTAHPREKATAGDTAATAATPFDRAYWEDRYGAPGLTWSGNPNPVLVTEVATLTPGRALDAGSGEGGDALWLAQLGWQVTAVDISTNALDKGQARAESVDPAAAARIDWQQHDITEWAPDVGAFDLISSQFMHLAEPARTRFFRALASSVAVGGTLLIVGHDASDSLADGHSAHLMELMFGVDDVVNAIDGLGLTIEVAEIRQRAAMHEHGEKAWASDVVVRATRAS
jgi:SAM-dependent methyltransferase